MQMQVMRTSDAKQTEWAARETSPKRLQRSPPHREHTTQPQPAIVMLFLARSDSPGKARGPGFL